MSQIPDPELSTEAAIVIFDSRGRIKTFNRGAEKIMGLPRELALWQPLDTVFRLPKENRTFKAQLPSAGYKKQINIDTHTGETISLMVTRIKIDSEPFDNILILRDLTEEQAAKNLQSYFLGSISHEFRTPLSALNASVELLLDDLDELSHAEIAHLLNSVHFSVAGLQTLIDNLLESTNIQAGQFRLRVRRASLHQIADDALQVMRPLLDRRQQTLTRYIPRQLPTVKVDPTRLTQVLVNLISNASKYSPIGTTIELTLRVEHENQLYVMVADRGPGIPVDEREDIFRRYVRLSDKEDAQYGVGLGLSVVKAIIEKHGGQIAVEDNPGGGSIFWFTVPLEVTEGETE